LGEGKFQREVLLFLRYQNFVITQFTIGKRKLPRQKQSIRLVVSIHCLLVTDGQTDRRTDGQTHDDSIYRAIIASRGKKNQLDPSIRGSTQYARVLDKQTDRHTDTRAVAHGGR